MKLIIRTIIILLFFILFGCLFSSIHKKKITVLCSSSDNISSNYFNNVEKLIKKIDPSKVVIVNGGGTGLMGHVDQTFKSIGGETIRANYIGFIKSGEKYDFLYNSLAERTEQLLGAGEEYLFLPGGLGTAWEFFESLTENNTGITNKKIYVYNMNGYFDKLLQFIHDADKQKFIRFELSKLNLYVSDNIDDIADRINGKK